jgi:hypothetical protein
MFHSLATCMGLLISWINPIAVPEAIGGLNQVTSHQKALGVVGATLSRDRLSAITPAPKFPLVKKQVNSFVGYISDANGC